MYVIRSASAKLLHTSRLSCICMLVHLYMVSCMKAMLSVNAIESHRKVIAPALNALTMHSCASKLSGSGYAPAIGAFAAYTCCQGSALGGRTCRWRYIGT